jgi:hypothetical protein
MGCPNTLWNIWLFDVITPWNLSSIIAQIKSQDNWGILRGHDNSYRDEDPSQISIDFFRSPTLKCSPKGIGWDGIRKSNDAIEPSYCLRKKRGASYDSMLDLASGCFEKMTIGDCEFKITPQNMSSGPLFQITPITFKAERFHTSIWHRQRVLYLPTCSSEVFGAAFRYILQSLAQPLLTDEQISEVITYATADFETGAVLAENARAGALADDIWLGSLTPSALN